MIRRAPSLAVVALTTTLAVSASGASARQGGTPLLDDWLASAEGLRSSLELAIQEAPGRYDLRWIAAREYSNAAAVERDEDVVKDFGRAARDHALVAVELDPSGVEGHYWLAVAAGVLAEAEGGRTKVRMAEESWNESGWILQRDSLHAGAHHLQGRIHAAVMRVGSITRFLARLLLGGEVLGQASWERAEYHLRRAADLDPDVAMHHFELAMAFRDTDRPEAMLAALERAARAAGGRPIDERYRERAAALLEGRSDRN